ncbi:uncharacterized protein MONBRDRAFT_38736, partial [Monosiga brevicollis MX1]
MTDVVAFLGKPATILRIVELIFAIIVFGTLADNGTIKLGDKEGSIFNNKMPPLNFGIAIGVLGFLDATAWLCVSFLHHTSGLLKPYKPTVNYVRIGLDFFFSLMFMIAGAALAAQWNKVSSDAKDAIGSKYLNAARTAIAFSFFLWLLYIASAYFSYTELSEPEEDY